MRGVRDIDLLRLEMDTLWGPDAYGRPLRSHPFVAIAAADDGQAIRIGPDVPRDLRKAFMKDDLLFAVDPGGSQPPLLVEKYRELLTERGPTRVDGGPSYVFAEGVLDPPSASSTLLVFLSDEGVTSKLRDLRPEPWWEPKEWEDLLAGRLGPWAIAVARERVVALCHTSAASSRCAEAGVWTHPDERGHGLATTMAAAWANVAGVHFETLFYSTTLDNVASQAVAKKLRLRSIGSIWKIN